ncbi:MAG: hypothetical protein IJE25_00290 [Clostridia bacterium]|nr:hypothetical protein [Clostridia bacterium]
MKPILMDNAFEAWTAAVRFCNAIKDGKATLQYQKNFVSSLHNAVELIMKQMMLNNNDHDVAFIKKQKDEIDEKLSLNYSNATDLNRFFVTLSSDEISRFHTIPFYKLIQQHKKLFAGCLEQGKMLTKELKLLQRLRNNETHFMIRQGSFLSEDDFRTLHNFMVQFYKIMKKWNPSDKADLESSIFLYLYWYSPDKDDSMYEFECELLQDFSYESAVRNSKLARDIAERLKDNHQCGAPKFSPYDIAFELINGHDQLSAEFDEVWAMVYMMQSLGMIDVQDIQDIQGNIHEKIKVLF